MVTVRRANVLLTVPDSEVDKYFAKGFSVLDASGKVVKQHVPTELSQLQKAYSDHVEQIKELTSEIARLKSLLDAGETKSPAVKSKHVDAEENNWTDWEESEELEEKPAKKGKKTKS